MTACTSWYVDTRTSSGTDLFGRKLCIWRHNQQLFANKAALRPIGQIIDNRLVRFSYSSFKMVYFQRPDWVCGSFSPPFKFAGLIQISYIDKWGELFFFQASRSGILCRGFGGDRFLFDCDSWFFSR